MWFIQIGGIIGFFICLVIMYCTPYGIRGIRKYDSAFQMPDMKFHYSVEELTKTFEKIGVDGQAIYQNYLVLDCIFVVCFGICMLTLTHNLFTGLSRNILFFVCFLRGFFDLLENFLLLFLLKSSYTNNIYLASLCSYLTTFKFIMLYIWIVAIIVHFTFTGIIKLRGNH